MKYTSKQLKDLAFLARKGCIDRTCNGCMWEKLNTFEKYRCSFIEEDTSYLWTSKAFQEIIKKAARTLIREII